MSGEWTEKLVAVLAVEERVYRELRLVLAEERDRMLAMDADSLYALAARKEALADEGRLAAEGRAALVARLAGSLSVPERLVTLGRLCEALGEETAKPLREAQSRLVAVVGAVHELADANRVLGGERLSNVQTTLQLLGRLSPTVASTRSADGGNLVRTSA